MASEANPTMIRMPEFMRGSCHKSSDGALRTLDRATPVRKDLSVLNSVQLRFQLKGVTAEQGPMLIDRFKGR